MITFSLDKWFVSSAKSRTLRAPYDMGGISFCCALLFGYDIMSRWITYIFLFINYVIGCNKVMLIRILQLIWLIEDEWRIQASVSYAIIGSAYSLSPNRHQAII